jgi:hypothetical protein
MGDEEDSEVSYEDNAMDEEPVGNMKGNMAEMNKDDDADEAHF